MSILIPKYNNFSPSILLFSDIEDMTPVEIVLPDPPNINKIANYNLPQVKQKFYRTELPKRFSGLPNSDKQEFINQEWKRRKHGYWFMNNGELIYITGLHYFFINWWKLNIGYPDYRNTHREFFLHWKKAEEDPTCFGLIEITKRQSGKTYKAGCMLYEYTSRSENVRCGMQSKTDDDAIKFFNKAIIQPWRKLPYFFQPVCDNTTNPKEKLSFFYPATRGKGSKVDGEMVMQSELESILDCQPALEISYDGQTLRRYVGDEEGKCLKSNVSDRWEKVKPCLETNGVILGKALHTSTVEEMEKQGGKNFYDIWDTSRFYKKDRDGKTVTALNSIGRTESGLWQHFTPSDRDYYFDEYGNPLIEKSRKKLEADIEQVKNKPSKIMEIKRKYPLTIRDCFRKQSNDCNFNSLILENRIYDLKDNNPYVVRGNFEWHNNIPFTTVVWMPHEQGKFLCSHILKPHEANQYFTQAGMKMPSNTHRFCAGGDPFKYNETLGGRGSLGGGAVFMKRDIHIDKPDLDRKEWTTNRFCCTYANRPDTQVYAEDMLKMCIYFGCEMNTEINVTLLWDYFRNNGYTGYLFYRIDKKTDAFARTPGQTTTLNIQEEIYQCYDYYIDYDGHREFHTELLQECLDIEQDMGKFDRFVAGGYALLANKKEVVTVQDQIIHLEDFFETHQRR